MSKARDKTTQIHNMYVADFETGDTPYTYSIDNVTGEEIKYQRVWLAGHKNLSTMESKVFTSIDDFMEDILSRKDNCNREVAFHNLKFDGSFILPYLFREGYVVADGKPNKGEFSVLVDNRNNWYNLTVQVTTKRKVTFWDMLKLFPMPLQYLPEVYDTPTQKIQEDTDFYTKYRPLDYKPDKRDLAYFENDLQVPAEVLNKHIEFIGLRFKKTQASQAFHNFEQTFPAWRLRFKALSDEVDRAVRPAYWGGISFVPNHKAGKDYYNVGVYDINSSYPHKASENRLPYGNPVSMYEDGGHPDMSKFWIAECTLEFKLKSKNHLPCIPSKAITENRPMFMDKWVSDSEGVVKIRLSNIDYEIIQQSYDVNIITWEWSIHWKWKRQKEVSKFVHMNNDNKMKYGKLADGADNEHDKVYYKALRQRAKIDNNAFYGKFGEEVIKEGKTPAFDGEEIEWLNDRVEVQSEYSRKFLPVAIAITAWGRKQLVEMANILGEHFLYCDTDSIHYLVEGGQEKIDKAIKDGVLKEHPHDLGAWDFEGFYKKGRYLRAKCYMEEKEDGTKEATVAGLPPDKNSGAMSKSRSCLTWENFRIGLIVPPEQTNKLRNYRTPTGNKLLPTSFEIKQREGLL